MGDTGRETEKWGQKGRDTAGPLPSSVRPSIRLTSEALGPTGCRFMAQGHCPRVCVPQVCAPESWSAEWAGAVIVTPPPLLPATV